MAVNARNEEDAKGDGAKKRETSEDSLAGGKERKERKSGGKSPCFCTPVPDGWTGTYVLTRTDMCGNV